jgi:hypothetical protein
VVQERKDAFHPVGSLLFFCWEGSLDSSLHSMTGELDSTLQGSAKELVDRHVPSYHGAFFPDYSNYTCS